MTRHLRPTILFALLFASFAISAFSQVEPSATSGVGRLTFDAGAGVSDYNMDYSRGHEWGGTLWLDVNPHIGSSFLRNFSVEVEARDLSRHRGPYLPNNMRTDTLGGGLKYSWHLSRNFRPYVKALASYGSLDLTKPGYHWTWVEYAPGGGIDYRPFGHIWLRVDYEYQVWPSVITYPQTITLDPQGFTVGALYEFGRRHDR
jgi:opacity protein-like surface antigen